MKKENLSLTEANPMHIILNPGKSKGASSDRNKAGRIYNFVNFGWLLGVIRY